MVGERILQGLCRWSWLAERCTQAQCPWPAGTALCLFPRPVRLIWCLVCLWWCAGNASRREMGRGRGVPTRACMRHLGPAGWSALKRNRPSLHSAPRIQQASISAMVCGRGGGARAVAGEGAVKGLCARMQAHADVRQFAVIAPLLLLQLPQPNSSTSQSWHSLTRLDQPQNSPAHQAASPCFYPTPRGAVAVRGQSCAPSSAHPREPWHWTGGTGGPQVWGSSGQHS